MMPANTQTNITIHWNTDDKDNPLERTWDAGDNNDTDYGHGMMMPMMVILSTAALRIMILMITYTDIIRIVVSAALWAKKAGR